MIIENSKTYSLTDVENIFFRPTFCGKAAEEMGIRVLYNMPMPTKVPLFSHNNNILKTFASGWQGGSSSTLKQKQLAMTKVKAESAYSAEDYFSTIYEIIATSSDVNLGDLTGTELEKAETELFRRSLAESIYATTWFGDTNSTISEHSTFAGFLSHFLTVAEAGDDGITLRIVYDDTECAVTDILRNAWTGANDELRALISEGQLAYFVSSNIYDAYQFYLDDNGLSDMQADVANGRPILTYHGIPLIEVPTNGYELNSAHTFCVLTDRRNLVLALNTADSPEKEIRMWYNPDEMENRQRVVFLAGTTIVDEKLLSGDIFEGSIMFG